jgi:hypothetical protein
MDLTIFQHFGNSGTNESLKKSDQLIMIKEQITGDQ